MHFSVLVILKKGQKIDKVLEPFASDVELPEYDSKCWCVSGGAREAVAKTHNFDKDVRAAYYDLPESQQTQTLWRSMVKAHREKAASLVRAHPLFGKPDPACTECKGTGLCKSTSNPQGHWDWYEIGGRWEGALTNKRGKKVNKLKVKDYSLEAADLAQHKELLEVWEKIEAKLATKDDQSQNKDFMNMSFGYDGEQTFEEYSVKHKSNGISAYALLSDGVWMEHQEFDMETMEHLENPDYEQKLSAALRAASPDDELVMVDCHN